MNASLLTLSILTTLLLSGPRMGHQNGGGPHTEQSNTTREKQVPPPAQPTVVPLPTSPLGEPHPWTADKAPAKRVWKRFFAPQWISLYVTVAYVFIAGWTLIVIQRQTKATVEASLIANKMLIATFRPRVIVRSVHIVEGTMIPTSGQEGTPWYLSYTLTNVGGSDTTVVLRVVQVISLGKVLSAIPPHDESKRDETVIRLAPGGHNECRVVIPKDVVDILRHMGNSVYETQADKTCFLGYLRFSDDNGITRSVGVCRFRDYKTKRFIPVQDPEYEYAD